MAKKEEKVATTTAKKKTTTKTATKKTNKPVTKKVANKSVKSEPKKEVKKNTKTTIIQEENSYGRTLIAAIVIVLLAVGGYFGYQYKQGNLDLPTIKKYEPTADEAKFKKAYESLNDVKKQNGSTHSTVEVIEDNNIEYIEPTEAAKILNEGDGIIYFGFSSCPWCRALVPVLLNAMESSNLDKIYYVDMRPDNDKANDIRDSYNIVKNKAKKTKEGAEGYNDILIALADELEDYVLVSEDGKKINTGVERLYAPTVVAVKNGEVIAFHEGTVEGHDKDEEGNLADLTDKQKEELNDILSKMISSYLDEECSTDGDGC